jgi:hypothetical protein
VKTMLERVGANPIGVVVGGVKQRRDPYYDQYGYAYGYARETIVTD